MEDRGKRMDRQRSSRAYNALVLNAHALIDEEQGIRRAAAIASIYMGVANNGGINSALTCTPELASIDLLRSLKDIGAGAAAEQLEIVFNALGEHLPDASQQARHDALEQLWTEEIDAQIEDVLSLEADESLMDALQNHAERHADYYLAIEARFENEISEPSFFSRLKWKLLGR